MNRFVLLLVSIALFPLFASAHQPRLVTNATTVVVDPEVSKAYYAELSGEPHIYHIETQESLNLYVNILVPKTEGTKKDVSFAVIKEGDLENPLVVEEGSRAEWKEFFEEYAHDAYWQGAEYKQVVIPGVYEVRVWSSNNDSKYVLAIGEKEFFDAREGFSALRLIPTIKKEFFETTPATFLLSKIGSLYALVVVVLGAATSLIVFGLVYLLKRGSGYGCTKNLGLIDRLIRVILGVALFLLAITTNWSFILLGLSGYVLGEAVLGWCGLYTLVGRNTRVL